MEHLPHSKFNAIMHNVPTLLLTNLPSSLLPLNIATFSLSLGTLSTSPDEKSSALLHISFSALFCIHAWNVQIPSFFWSVFSHIRTEYSVSHRIQSECKKIWTRKNSVYGRLARSDILSKFRCMLNYIVLIFFLDCFIVLCLRFYTSG